eukprot:TRINITY_DN6611_c0_g1_i1.p1 TRINITY_DN6611_c0_g1~~TRINITY_DN6611_c0_g1_i1.p1  ORF type:complete len:501 (-),score=150.08 TRINITY_DN6611_c0_g1_i1:782-2254(-)
MGKKRNGDESPTGSVDSESSEALMNAYDEAEKKRKVHRPKDARGRRNHNNNAKGGDDNTILSDGGDEATNALSFSKFVGSGSARNVIFLSLSFCLVFMSFSAAQNFQTSKGGSGTPEEAKVGSNALAILYFVFTFSTFFSSALVRTFGIKTALFCGASTYVLFVSSNIKKMTWFTYASAALEGIGAAALWTAQGAYVTNSVTEYELLKNLEPGNAQGSFNGLFFSIYNFNQFIGNMLVAVLFQFSISESTIFSIATVLCGLGAVSLLLLPVPTVEEFGDEELEEDDAADKPSLWSNFGIMAQTSFILLIPIIIYNGLSQGFIFGVLPALVSEPNIKFYTMAVFGITDTFASFGFGRISDRMGRKPFLILGTLFNSVAYMLVFSGKISGNALYFTCAVLLGLADAIWNTQPYAILGSFYEQDPAAAFANFKLFQSGSTAAAFFYYPYVSKANQALICEIFMVVGVVFVFGLDRFVKSIDPRGKRIAEVIIV